MARRIDSILLERAVLLQLGNLFPAKPGGMIANRISA
jgi:hypothetical protein